MTRKKRRRVEPRARIRVHGAARQSLERRDVRVAEDDQIELDGPRDSTRVAASRSPRPPSRAA